MNRRVGCLAIVALTLAACGVPSDRNPTVADDDSVPFSLLAPATTTTAPGPDDGPARTVPLCLQRGDRFVTVRRSFRSGEGELATILRSGPTRSESHDGLRSAIFADDLFVEVDVAGGIARVALGDSFTTGTLQDQLPALAQAVCTLTNQPGIGQVAFTLDGAPVDVPTGDGSLSSSPVSRDDYPNLLQLQPPGSS